MTATCTPGTQQGLNECSLNEVFMHETVGFLNRAAMACLKKKKKLTSFLSLLYTEENYFRKQ